MGFNPSFFWCWAKGFLENLSHKDCSWRERIDSSGSAGTAKCESWEGSGGATGFQQQNSFFLWRKGKKSGRNTPKILERGTQFSSLCHHFCFCSWEQLKHRVFINKVVCVQGKCTWWIDIMLSQREVWFPSLYFCLSFALFGNLGK